MLKLTFHEPHRSSLRTPSHAQDHPRRPNDAFKQFANAEKLRLRTMQEAKRSNHRATQDTTLEDLKKFSKNFKLSIPVPDDLVPILSKSHNKSRHHFGLPSNKTPLPKNSQHVPEQVSSMNRLTDIEHSSDDICVNTSSLRDPIFFFLKNFIDFLFYFLYYFVFHYTIS
jgi:hypothetical protein